MTECLCAPSASVASLTLHGSHVGAQRSTEAQHGLGHSTGGDRAPPGTGPTPAFKDESSTARQAQVTHYNTHYTHHAPNVLMMQQI